MSTTCLPYEEMPIDRQEAQSFFNEIIAKAAYQPGDSVYQDNHALPSVPALTENWHLLEIRAIIAYLSEVALALDVKNFDLSPFHATLNGLTPSTTEKYSVIEEFKTICYLFYKAPDGFKKFLLSNVFLLLNYTDDIIHLFSLLKKHFYTSSNLVDEFFEPYIHSAYSEKKSISIQKNITDIQINIISEYLFSIAHSLNLIKYELPELLSILLTLREENSDFVEAMIKDLKIVCYLLNAAPNNLQKYLLCEVLPLLNINTDFDDHTNIQNLYEMFFVLYTELTRPLSPLDFVPALSAEMQFNLKHTINFENMQPPQEADISDKVDAFLQTLPQESNQSNELDTGDIELNSLIQYFLKTAKDLGVLNFTLDVFCQNLRDRSLGQASKFYSDVSTRLKRIGYLFSQAKPEQKKMLLTNIFRDLNKCPQGIQNALTLSAKTLEVTMDPFNFSVDCVDTAAALSCKAYSVSAGEEVHFPKAKFASEFGFNIPSGINIQENFENIAGELSSYDHEMIFFYEFFQGCNPSALVYNYFEKIQERLQIFVNAPLTGNTFSEIETVLDLEAGKSYNGKNYNAAMFIDLPEDEDFYSETGKPIKEPVIAFSQAEKDKLFEYCQDYLIEKGIIREEPRTLSHDTSTSIPSYKIARNIGDAISLLKTLQEKSDLSPEEYFQWAAQVLPFENNSRTEIDIYAMWTNPSSVEFLIQNTLRYSEQLFKNRTGLPPDLRNLASIKQGIIASVYCLITFAADEFYKYLSAHNNEENVMERLSNLFRFAAPILNKNPNFIYIDNDDFDRLPLLLRFCRENTTTYDNEMYETVFYSKLSIEARIALFMATPIDSFNIWYLPNWSEYEIKESEKAIFPYGQIPYLYSCFETPGFLEALIKIPHAFLDEFFSYRSIHATLLKEFCIINGAGQVTPTVAFCSLFRKRAGYTLLASLGQEVLANLLDSIIKKLAWPLLDIIKDFFYLLYLDVHPENNFRILEKIILDPSLSKTLNEFFKTADLQEFLLNEKFYSVEMKNLVMMWRYQFDARYLPKNPYLQMDAVFSETGKLSETLFSPQNVFFVYSEASFSQWCHDFEAFHNQLSNEEKTNLFALPDYRDILVRLFGYDAFEVGYRHTPYLTWEFSKEQIACLDALVAFLPNHSDTRIQIKKLSELLKLWHAVSQNDIETVAFYEQNEKLRCLFDKRVGGRSLLMHAVTKNVSIEMLSLLGSLPDFTQLNELCSVYFHHVTPPHCLYFTPLELAISQGSVELVKKLLEWGAKARKPLLSYICTLPDRAFESTTRELMEELLLAHVGWPEADAYFTDSWKEMSFHSKSLITQWVCFATNPKIGKLNPTALLATCGAALRFMCSPEILGYAIQCCIQLGADVTVSAPAHPATTSLQIPLFMELLNRIEYHYSESDEWLAFTQSLGLMIVDDEDEVIMPSIKVPDSERPPVLSEATQQIVSDFLFYINPLSCFIPNVETKLCLADYWAKMGCYEWIINTYNRLEKNERKIYFSTVHRLIQSAMRNELSIRINDNSYRFFILDAPQPQGDDSLMNPNGKRALSMAPEEMPSKKKPVLKNTFRRTQSPFFRLLPGHTDTQNNSHHHHRSRDPRNDSSQNYQSRRS